MTLSTLQAAWAWTPSVLTYHQLPSRLLKSAMLVNIICAFNVLTTHLDRYKDTVGGPENVKFEVCDFFAVEEEAAFELIYDYT